MQCSAARGWPKMERQEYYDRVLHAARRLTGRERRDVRRELEGHIEDHMEALLALDYPQELAEERTLSAMGDPEEVGSELNRQYSPFWLSVKRLAMAVTALFVLLNFTGLLGEAGNIGDNLRARFCPEKLAAVQYHSDNLHAVEDVDLRAEMGDVTVRVYQVGLDAPTRGTTAYVALCAWYQNPLKEQPNILNWNMDVWVESSSGHRPSGGSGWKWAFIYEVPVNYGDTVEITYDRFGQQMELTVELPWEEAES